MLLVSKFLLKSLSLWFQEYLSYHRSPIIQHTKIVIDFVSLFFITNVIKDIGITAKLLIIRFIAF